MAELDDEVVRHYEAVREEDRIVHGFARLELVRVQQILRRHLPDPPADILDVGGATGVHARWLADDGYRVRIVDLTPRHVEQANAELGELGVVAEVGDARHLAAADDSFDAALLFGPLYHLTEHGERITALREAARVTRPGGIVAIAAINRFASLFDGLCRRFLLEPDFLDVVTQDLATGQHRNPEQRPHWFTTAFFHHPHELEEEVTEAGLTTRELVGVEGLAAYLPQLSDSWENADSRDVILWAAQTIEAEPTLLGLSPHLLLIATAPAGFDAQLDARQAALQAEAAAIIRWLDLEALLADIGPVLLAGSYVSGLMSWPDLDVMVFAGPQFTPRDVLRLMERFVHRPEIVGFDYQDERGPRSPTNTVRDERYHVVIALDRNERRWRIDLTIWLNDPHQNVTAWHDQLRDTVTAEQRSAILRIKDVWHRLPSYPDDVGGFEIYQAVLDDGVRSPQQFAEWLTAHDLPPS
ncbi:MAG TPA: methyltransferase domain-containing protein [Jatrophihabitans sp.]|jgi:2-polyprenyl-3-methyl-5-hydroxy-6-metoxy-1,4-benzoquinol methylase|nr:methyltransferase domain-containing protein [Jatrophihabitans sp.]